MADKSGADDHKSGDGNGTLSPSKSAAGGLSGSNYTTLDGGILQGEAPIPNLGHRRMLQDKTFSDLHFTFGNKKVFAHSYVIWVRAEGLLNPKDKANLEKKKKKKDSGATGIEGNNKLSPRVVELVFDYVYNGFLKFSTISQHDILHLNVAAKSFKIDRLSFLCELYLRETLSLDNVHSLLKLSHDLKENSVKSFCLSFAVKHYNAFITNKSGVNDIGIDLFQEVVTRQASPGTDKDELPAAPANTYVQQWQHLHDEMLFSDAVAKVGNDKIRFHRAVLAAHSEALSNYLKANQGEEVPFQGISAEAFKSLLRFVYYGETKLAPIPATELINFCKQYELPELSKVCEEKIRDSVSTDTVLDILAVTYLPYMEKRQDIQELRRKALLYLLEHLTAVDLSPLRKLPPIIALDVLFACQAHEAKLPQPELSTSSASPAAALPPPNLSPRGAPSAATKPPPSVSPRKEPTKTETKELEKQKKEDEKKAKKEKKEAKEAEKKAKKEKKDKGPEPMKSPKKVEP